MTEQLIEAAILLAVGMSVVFSFLTLLIGGIKLIAWYALTFPSSVQVNKPIQQHNNNKALPKTSVKPDIVAAISAAVHIHRQKSQ